VTDPARGPLTRPVEEYERVRMWLRGYEESWGEPDPDAHRKLPVIEAFCRFAGRDPDAICSDCLRALPDGSERIRYRQRHHYIRLIEEFEAANPGGRRAGNVVRSFLIHNGVAMGGRATS